MRATIADFDHSQASLKNNTGVETLTDNVAFARRSAVLRGAWRHKG
jgi:hypothetical protein